MNHSPQDSIYHEETSPMSSQSYCPACGKAVRSEQAFCSACGAALKTSDPLTSPQQTEPESPTPPPKKKSKKWIIILSCVLGGIFLLGFLLIFLVVGILFFSNRSRPVEAVRLTEKNETVTLQADDTYTLKFSVTPTDADISDTTWTSSDPTVATVDQTGTITAKKKGTCTITVTVNGKSDSLDIIVRKDPDFKKLYNQYCNSSWATVGADNSYLFIDTNPYNQEDYYLSAAGNAIEAINAALGLPSSLNKTMGLTSWSMGRQSQTFTEQGVVVTWTYHPNKGMEVTYSLIYS